MTLFYIHVCKKVFIFFPFPPRENMPGQKDSKKAAGTRPEVSAAAAAVDDLRKRIAAEADIIVNETMPKKVLSLRLQALLPGAH